jgi:hypothetical protein
MCADPSNVLTFLQMCCEGTGLTKDLLRSAIETGAVFDAHVSMGQEWGTGVSPRVPTWALASEHRLMRAPRGPSDVPSLSGVRAIELTTKPPVNASTVACKEATTSMPSMLPDTVLTFIEIDCSKTCSNC